MTMKRFTRKKNRPTSLFALLLAVLGLGSCNTIEELNVFEGIDLGARAMYGVPTAYWSVKGKVINEDEKPVAGLQVVIGQRFYDTAGVKYDIHYKAIDTLMTGADGTFSYTKHGFPVQNLQADIHDIDGALGGGEFEDTTIIIKDIPYQGGDGWYVGTADVVIPDITVKKIIVK